MGGTGAVAYYETGAKWTFCEIDPAVVRVAQNLPLLVVLSGAVRCGASDARRQLLKAPDGSFDVIILDGFCSDAIPVPCSPRSHRGYIGGSHGRNRSDARLE